MKMKSNKFMKIIPSFNMSQTKRKLGMLSMLMLIGTASFAQSNDSSIDMLLLAVGVVALVAILVLVVAIYTLQILRLVIRNEEEKKSQAEGVASVVKKSWWHRFEKLVTRRADLKEEEDITLDHNYDGIRELDNHLPPWWTWLFYITIIFGVVYFVLHHVTKTLPLQDEEYQIEVAKAEQVAQERKTQNAESGGEAFDEANIQYDANPEYIAAGASIFKLQCTPCHRDDGGGNIGPNLTDNYWIHGGKIGQIYSTIKNGVPDKGMISWKAMLSPEQMRDLAFYIKSIKGSNPENPKAPQGELEKD